MFVPFSTKGTDVLLLSSLHAAGGDAAVLQHFVSGNVVPFGEELPPQYIPCPIVGWTLERGASSLGYGGFVTPPAQRVPFPIPGIPGLVLVITVLC